MIPLPLLGILSSIASVVVLLVLIAAVIGIIFLFGKKLAGLAINSVLGLISIFAVNSLFGLGISLAGIGGIITIIIIAIFGLPAVLVIVVLKLIGISI